MKPKPRSELYVFTVPVCILDYTTVAVMDHRKVTVLRCAAIMAKVERAAFARTHRERRGNHVVAATEEQAKPTQFCNKDRIRRAVRSGIRRKADTPLPEVKIVQPRPRPARPHRSHHEFQHPIDAQIVRPNRSVGALPCDPTRT